MSAPSRAESTHSIARCPDEGASDSGAVCRSSFASRWRRAEFDDDAAANGSRTIHPIGDLHRRGGYAGDSGLFSTLPAAGIEAVALRLHKRQAVRALIELVMMMRRTRPDVVVVQGYNAETLGRIAARIAGVKHTINWVHNASGLVQRGTVRRTVDRALTRWTSAYFGVAEAQRPYLVDELGHPDDKIRIIYNGVDLAQFRTSTDRGVRAEFGFAEDDPVVGIVARLRPEKDHVNLLRAARTVVDELTSARFLIIGDGPTRPQLEALCTELRITPNVHFAGSRDDVARLLPAIDVFVLTSILGVLPDLACSRPWPAPGRPSAPPSAGSPR